MTITFPAPDGNNDWHKTSPVVGSVQASDPSNVSAINCTPSGVLSGVTGLGTTTASGTLTVSAQGTTTVSCTATDGASSPNTSAATTATVKLDSVAPTITYDGQDPAANGNEWNNTDVVLDWSCDDATSLPVSATVSHTMTGEGASLSHTATCEDNAGNTASDTQTVKIDRTNPTIAFNNQSPAKVNGWNNSAVTVTWDCSDSLSGPAAAQVSQTVSTEGENQSATGTCTDLAGNSASDTYSDIDIDLTGPVVSVTGVSNGATYTLGSVPAAGCSTTDALSGVATAATLAMSGPGTTNPNGVGSFTATCSGAADNAGNAGNTATATYNVVYSGVSGFLAPLNKDALFQRGRSVPGKIQLAGDEPNGFDTSLWVLTRQPTNCGAVDSGAEQAVTSNTPSTQFRYDTTADQYIYNADFRNVSAGTCWKLKLQLDDGSAPIYSAEFKITK